jgi:dolichol-phosphate mannosyltransferase
MQITVVIPTYNEAENLPRLVSRLFCLPLEDLKVLIIDDNSPDGTGQIADQLVLENPARIRVLHRLGKLGLGSAYILGFQEAITWGSQAVGQMDADFSHPPEKLLELEQALDTCDVALGSRYIPGGQLDKDWPIWRKGLSTFGNFYARTILHLPIRDVTGGFRLWKREVLLSLPLHRICSNGYIFQVEMAYVAHRLGFGFSEVPFYFAERHWGQSKMSLRIQMEAAVRVWQLSRLYQDLKGYDSQVEVRKFPLSH